MFIISCLLCIIIFFVRQSRKKVVHAPNKMATEMSSDIKMNTNPSYESNKLEQNQEDEYDYVVQDHPNNKQGTIKMDTNPSYKAVQCANNDIAIQENPSYGTGQGTHDTTELDCNVAIQENPSYCFNLLDTKKALESENYIDVYSPQGTDHVKVIKEEKALYNEIDDITINPNPSYDSVLGGIELEDNPSYSYGIK